MRRATLIVAMAALAGWASMTFARSTSSGVVVPATRQPLTTDPESPVAHDTEVMALVAHVGRLFAATDQWEYPGPSPAGQVLVKSSRTGPWRVFEQAESGRVEALGSFRIPADQGAGAGHSLLITQVVVDGQSKLQWLRDRARSFAPDDAYALSTPDAKVRAFGAHRSDGGWAVYAGVTPTGVLRGAWSPATRTLEFDPTPELTAAPPGSPGQKTQKVTGFADCAGALYVSIHTKLFRRNDGPLAPGASRWTQVYDEGPVGPYNSGLRGLTCVDHRGAPALLVSSEGTGDVYRFDDLPRGPLAAADTTFTPTREFSPVPAIGEMLAAEGTAVPGSGIGYVIAAYNDFTTEPIGGVERQLFGIEWHYDRGCPTTRKCTPSGWEAAACFAVRSDPGGAPDYVLRCLGGRDFTPSTGASTPVRSGEAFVSIRTIERSPFGDRRLYYGGYDANFYPADGTAWIGSSTQRALQLDDRRKERP